MRLMGSGGGPSLLPWVLLTEALGGFKYIRQGVACSLCFVFRVLLLTLARRGVRLLLHCLFKGSSLKLGIYSTARRSSPDLHHASSAHVSVSREIVLQPELRSPESVAFPNSRFEDVDGLKVHFLREDPGVDDRTGDAPPGCVLHMNHGFGASSSSWSPVIRRLSRKLGALAVAHDTPGFGLTARAGLSEANRYSLRTNAGENTLHNAGTRRRADPDWGWIV